jgi:hypothetical protein
VSNGGNTSNSQRICGCSNLIFELPIADCRLPIEFVNSRHESH